MPRGSIPVIVLLLILLSSAIIGAFYFYGKNFINSKQLPTAKPTDAPTQKPPEPSNENASWKIYTNEKYDFSVKYTNSYQLKENKASVKLESVYLEKNAEYIAGGLGGGTVLSKGGVVSFAAHPNKDLSENALKDEYGSDITTKKTLVGNQEGLEIVFSPKQAGGRRIYIKQKDFVLEISSIGGFDSSSSDQQMYAKEFDQILSTFKFTENIKLDVSEKARIDIWIEENNLNQYGDPKDTVYTGGTPLFDEATGETKDRYDYIVEKHPDRPWNR